MLTRSHHREQGLKLRRLTCKAKTDNEVSWPTPRQPSASFGLCRLTSGPIRLAHFRINEADTTGYHACLDGDTVAFRTPKAGYAASRPAVIHGNWLYMPLNPGDWIREVWLRGRTSPPYRSALIVRTTCFSFTKTVESGRNAKLTGNNDSLS